MLAATVQAQQDRLCKEAVETDRCLVCLEPPREPTVLPCGHSFCTGCVSELRAKGVSDSCPACRAPLPPGPEKLYDLAFRVWQRLNRAASDGTLHNGAWRKLSVSEQDEMDGAIVMLQEATDQVSWGLGEGHMSWGSGEGDSSHPSHSPIPSPCVPGSPRGRGAFGRRVLLGAGRGDRLLGGDGGVQGWCRGG